VGFTVFLHGDRVSARRHDGTGEDPGGAPGRKHFIAGMTGGNTLAQPEKTPGFIMVRKAECIPVDSGIVGERNVARRGDVFCQDPAERIAQGMVSNAATGASRSFRIARASACFSRSLSCRKQSFKRGLAVMTGHSAG
jgi:hypothetical protein